MESDRKLTIPQTQQFKEAFDVYDPQNVGVVSTRYSYAKHLETIDLFQKDGSSSEINGFQPNTR